MPRKTTNYCYPFLQGPLSKSNNKRLSAGRLECLIGLFISQRFNFTAGAPISSFNQLDFTQAPTRFPFTPLIPMGTQKCAPLGLLR